MKHVLFITYGFPPAAYVGVHRTLKFCEYLPSLGWLPIVLTIRTDGVTFTDDNLLKKIPPDVPVYRTYDVDPLRWLNRPSARNTTQVNSPPTGRTSAHGGPSVGRRLLRFLKHIIIGLLIKSPDSHIFWMPFALIRGIRILLSHDVRLIYCSTPPHSSLLIAYLLANCFRKRYVIDFRDPWFVTESANHGQGKAHFITRIERWMKNRIVREASRIITVSEGERADLIREHPDVIPSRFVCITNGYDPTDFNGAHRTVKSRSKFVITHTGTIYRGTAGEFFKALESVLSTHPELRDRLEVNLIGAVDDEYSMGIERPEFLGVVKAHGLLPHAVALGCAMNSDLLLILVGGDFFRSSHLPAKVFEYLFTGTPILAVTKDGDLATILRKSALGHIVLPHDVLGLENTLLQIYYASLSEKQPACPDWDYIRQFDRTILAKRLASTFDEIVPA